MGTAIATETRTPRITLIGKVTGVALSRKGAEDYGARFAPRSPGMEKELVLFEQGGRWGFEVHYTYTARGATIKDIAGFAAKAAGGEKGSAETYESPLLSYGVHEVDEEIVHPDTKRWTPPSRDRVTINIHPEARDDLVNLLVYGDLGTTGVGYSEFVRAAVSAFMAGDFEVPGIDRKSAA